MIAPGNTFAILTILFWPIITLLIFRSTTTDRAIVWSLLGAALFLPVSTTIKLPLFPNLNKESLSVVTALLIIVFSAKKGPVSIPSTPVIRFLLILYIVVPVITVMTNTEPQVSMFSRRPGLGLLELQNMLVGKFIYLVPFVLGYSFLHDPKAHKALLQVIVVAALFYSLLVLYEIRMSPRLHSIIYGYFPHDWRQQLRDGGFRSVAFLGHGLLVSVFLMSSVIAAASFVRSKVSLFNINPLLYCGFLAGVLVLNKSMAAIVFAVSAVSAIFVLNQKLQLKVAGLIVILCLTYPFLRGAELFPTQKVVEIAAIQDETRAASLAFRFEQEKGLLEWAERKPWFGWGIWGRSRPMTDQTGVGTAVTDGYWMLVLGEDGWLGYIACFGLMGLPVLFAYKGVSRSGEKSQSTAGMAMVLAFIILDQLPNDSMRPWVWLISGSLIGFYEKHRLLRSSSNNLAVKKREGASGTTQG